MDAQDAVEAEVVDAEETRDGLDNLLDGIERDLKKPVEDAPAVDVPEVKTPDIKVPEIEPEETFEDGLY